MPKPDLQKHTLLLREGDYEFLNSIYRAKRLTAAVVIRALVSSAVDRIKQQANLSESPDLQELPDE